VEALVKLQRQGLPGTRSPTGATSRGPLRSLVGAPLGAASIAVVGGFVALVACLLVLGSLADAVREQEAIALDTVATSFLHGLASPALDQLMNAATFMGSTLVIPPLFAIAAIWLASLHRFREALFLAIASGGSLVLNETMKLFFHRPRPQLDWAQVLPDYSFPSGHAMNSVVFYVALAVVLWSVRGRRTGLVSLAIGIALSLLVGVSRIYLGYHYFTDVVGGLLAGMVWLLVVAGAFQSGPLWRLWCAARARGSTELDEPPETGR
jgi:undecaprenyl-diphosphatase